MQPTGLSNPLVAAKEGAVGTLENDSTQTSIGVIGTSHLAARLPLQQMAPNLPPWHFNNLFCLSAVDTFVVECVDFAFNVTIPKVDSNSGLNVRPIAYK